MNKEMIAEKEINLSHDLSGKVTIRKERLEPREGQYQKTIVLQNLKTA
jgi:hypothetical protein